MFDIKLRIIQIKTGGKTYANLSWDEQWWYFCLWKLRTQNSGHRRMRWSRIASWGLLLSSRGRRLYLFLLRETNGKIDRLKSELKMGARSKSWEKPLQWFQYVRLLQTYALMNLGAALEFLLIPLISAIAAVNCSRLVFINQHNSLLQLRGAMFLRVDNFNNLSNRSATLSQQLRSCYRWQNKKVRKGIFWLFE